MASEVNEQDLRRYAQEFTDEVNAGATESGEPSQVQLLSNVKESLGESKLLNDPQFFYWQMPIPPMTVELCGYDIDEIDNSLSLFAIDLGEPYHQIDKAMADKLGNRAVNFVRAVLAKNKALLEAVENEAFDLKDEIIDRVNSREGLSKIRVYILSNGHSIMRNRESQTAIKDQKIDVTYIVWDIKWIYENCNLQKEHEEIILDLKNDENLSRFVNGGLPYLEVPQADPLFNCYQCVVPGTLLSYIYREYGSPLLEGNVRSFLTTKTQVNKQIQLTISKEPQRFYIYNNGIAAVATGVETEVVNGVPLIVKINDIQIINGGQTTASLAYGQQKLDRDLSRISVSMKLTVIHASDDDVTDENAFSNLIQTISRTSNSQNKISDADFFSNHPFHTAMKRYSENLAVPGAAYNTYWFYERARGEYLQNTMFKTDSQKKAFEKTHPKDMYLTKTDFAKYYGILAKKPDVVSKGGVACFKDFAKFVDEEYSNDRSSRFNEVFFKEVTSVARMYRVLQEEITPKKQTWFKGSYRANVLNYGLALFFYLIGEQSNEKIDLTIVWSRGMSDPFKAMLLDLCRLTYEMLTDPDRKVENVTQYAKRAECWKKIKDELGDTQLDMSVLAPYLKNRLEVASAKKEAREEKKVQDDVDAYSRAFDLKHRNLWEPLYFFVEKNKNMFPKFDRATEIVLEHMAKVMKGKSIVSKEDCKIALEILEEAELYGFTGK